MNVWLLKPAAALFHIFCFIWNCLPLSWLGAQTIRGFNYEKIAFFLFYLWFLIIIRYRLRNVGLDLIPNFSKILGRVKVTLFIQYFRFTFTLQKCLMNQMWWTKKFGLFFFSWLGYADDQNKTISSLYGKYIYIRYAKRDMTKFWTESTTLLLHGVLV